jgi:hypothetical protein
MGRSDVQMCQAPNGDLVHAIAHGQKRTGGRGDNAPGLITDNCLPLPTDQGQRGEEGRIGCCTQTYCTWQDVVAEQFPQRRIVCGLGESSGHSHRPSPSGRP